LVQNIGAPLPALINVRPPLAVRFNQPPGVNPNRFINPLPGVANLIPGNLINPLQPVPLVVVGPINPPQPPVNPLIIMAAPVAPAAPAQVHVSSAHKPPTFFGISSENPSEYLRLFEVYANIHGLPLVEPAVVPAIPVTRPTCYRFQASISADAARWFQSHPPAAVNTYPLIRALFIEKYCNLTNDWTENVTLRSIKQEPNMSVSIFCMKFTDQCTRMGKDPNDCIPDLVQGLTPEIRKEVIMKSPTNCDEVIKYAKLAEIVIKSVKENQSVVTTLQDPLAPQANALELSANLKDVVQSLSLLTHNFKDPKSNENNVQQASDNSQNRSNPSNGPNRNSGQFQNNNRNRNQRGNNRNSGFNRNQGSWNRGNRNNRSNFQNRNPRPGGGRRINGNCYNCGLFGHAKSTCRRPAMANQNKTGQPNSNSTAIAVPNQPFFSNRTAQYATSPKVYLVEQPNQVNPNVPQLMASATPQLVYTDSATPSEYSIVSSASNLQHLNQLGQNM
jgi:hypothetical protein